MMDYIVPWQGTWGSLCSGSCWLPAFIWGFMFSDTFGLQGPLTKNYTARAHQALPCLSLLLPLAISGGWPDLSFWGKEASIQEGGVPWVLWMYFCLSRFYFFVYKLRIIIPPHFYLWICVIHLTIHQVYQLQIPQSTQKYFQHLLRSLSSTVSCVPSCNSHLKRFILLIKNNRLHFSEQL